MPVSRSAEPDRPHLVLGATGGLGLAVVRVLRARGLPLRALVRDPEKAARLLPDDADLVVGDALSSDDVALGASGAAAVHFCVNAPWDQWETFLPTAVDATLQALDENGPVLVFPDNTYLYGHLRSVPFDETHPVEPASTIGRVRGEQVARLLAAHREGRVKVVVARFPNFFGPNVTNRFAGGMFQAALDGGRARWLGDLDQPHSMIFVDDCAEAMLRLATDDRAWGEVWHVPGADAVTGREFLTMVFEEAGTRPRMTTLRSGVARILGLVVPMVRAVHETMYHFDEPMVMDGSRYEHTFGPAPATPHREAIRHTLAWFRDAAEQR